MRKFTRLEKEILKGLYQDYNDDKDPRYRAFGVGIRKFVFKFFQHRKAMPSINFVSSDIRIRFLEAYDQRSFYEIAEFIIVAANLLQYLIDNQLIFSLRFYKEDSYNWFPDPPPDEFFELPFLNQSHKNKFLGFYRTSFILSADIITFIENNFKTETDIMNEENLLIAKKNSRIAERNGELAVLLAILGGLFAALSTLTANALSYYLK